MPAKQKDYFGALYEVARVINASLSPGDVLEQIVAQVAQTMKVKACSLRLLDARRRKLLMGAQTGLSDGYIRKGPVLVKESGLDRQALKGETLHLANAQTAELIQRLDHPDLERVVLAHLSETNNRPDLALRAVRPVLDARVSLCAAEQDRPSSVFALGNGAKGGTS